jgi:hypothetical protein
MSEPAKNPFDLLLEQFRVIVREEIKAALTEKSPAKLRFTKEEAAAKLNCTPSWLANKVRAGEVPHQRAAGSHRIYFTQQDIDQIVASFAVTPKKGTKNDLDL